MGASYLERAIVDVLRKMRAGQTLREDITGVSVGGDRIGRATLARLLAFGLVERVAPLPLADRWPRYEMTRKGASHG